MGRAGFGWGRGSVDNWTESKAGSEITLFCLLELVDPHFQETFQHSRFDIPLVTVTHALRQELYFKSGKTPDVGLPSPAVSLRLVRLRSNFRNREIAGISLRWNHGRSLIFSGTVVKPWWLIEERTLESIWSCKSAENGANSANFWLATYRCFFDQWERLAGVMMRSFKYLLAEKLPSGYLTHSAPPEITYICH